MGYSPWGCKRVGHDQMTKQPQQPQQTYIYTIHIYMCIYINIYIHSRILLSHKKNEILPLVAIRMELEIIILNEANQTKTNII